MKKKIVFAQLCTNPGTYKDSEHFHNMSILDTCEQNYLIINPGEPNEFKLYIVFNAMYFDILLDLVTYWPCDVNTFPVEQKKRLLDLLIPKVKGSVRKLVLVIFVIQKISLKNVFQQKFYL